MDLTGRLKKGAPHCGGLRVLPVLVFVFSPALWGQPEGFFGGYVAFPYRGNSPFNYSAALGAASNPFSLRLLNQTLPTTSCIAFSGAANCFPGSQAAANALFGAQQSAAVQRADAVIASVFGGANPFLGQRVPSQEFANFGSSNPVRSGFGGWATDPTLQTVLGFSSGSNVNIGTAFLQNFNSAFSPFGGSGFGGFSLRAREPLMSAAPPVASLDDLNRRWQALAAREIDYYYTDGNLSALRAESDTLSLVGSYGIPIPTPRSRRRWPTPTALDSPSSPVNFSKSTASSGIGSREAASIWLWSIKQGSVLRRAWCPCSLRSIPCGSSMSARYPRFLRSRICGSISFNWRACCASDSRNLTGA